MILTVTPNPAIDLDFIVSGFRSGGRYRARVSRRSPGGAGINASIILSRLGCPSVAMGFLAGFDGAYILDALRREGVSTHFTHTRGETRINVCVIDTEDNTETRLYEQGIEVSGQDGTAFLRNYERILGRAEIVFIGGSLPVGVEPSLYAEMVRRAKNSATPVVVNPRKSDLQAVLAEAPTVVKLDRRVPSGEPEDLDLLKGSIQRLHDQGTEWVIASLTREKTVFSSLKGAWLAEVPSEALRYVYATEDALMAGVLASLRERAGPEETVRFAMACYWECATHPEKFPSGRACVEERLSGVLLSPIS